MYLCIPLRLLGLLLQCSGRHFVYWSLQRTLFLTLTLPLRFVTHTTIMPSCCGYVVLASQPAKQTLSSAVFAFCNLISPPFHPYRICHRAFIAPILYFHSAVYLVPTNQTTCQWVAILTKNYLILMRHLFYNTICNRVTQILKRDNWWINEDEKSSLDWNMKLNNSVKFVCVVGSNKCIPYLGKRGITNTF